jgi:ABC-2 type transport system permease protein
MSALLRAELLKLRTTRTFAALVAVAVALSLLVVVLSAVLQDDVTPTNVLELFTFDFTALFILVLGVLGMAGEWRHRTIASTVLAAPDRLRLLTAKTLSYAVAGVVLSLGPTAGAPNGIVGMNPIDDGELLAPGLAVVVMLAWIAAGFAAAAALLRVAIWCDAW